MDVDDLMMGEVPKETKPLKKESFLPREEPARFEEPSHKTENVTGSYFLFTFKGDYPVLNVSQEKWLEMYNMDVTPYLDNIDYKNVDYLSWSHAWRLLKINFPTYQAYWERDWNSGGRFYFMDNDSPYILAYIGCTETGARSLPVYFPILDLKMKATKGSPDGVLLNKNLFRAATKAIALTTGIGLRLWTREDLDNTAKVELIARIRAAGDQYREKSGQDHPAIKEASLGLTESELKAIGKKVVNDIKELTA